MKITLEELLAFISVVDSGSITAAADRLGQTTSGISRALSRLENKLDTPLMRRTTRRLELTEEGQSFLSHARAIISSVENAEEQMAMRRQMPAGRLRVNAAAPFMAHVLVPMVAEFRRRFPLIELELDTDDRNIDLLEKRADIAIRIGALRDSTLHARLLGNSRLRILASPDYLQRHGQPRCVEELRSHSLLGFTYPDSLNHWPLRHGQARHFAIEPTLSASSGETLRELALRGAGIVQLADFMTRRDRDAGRLVTLLEQETLDVRQPINAVYYRNTQLAARITCFLDYVSAHIDAQTL
ncbi:LysR family transcriptional regulator [Serratia marcescens]|uniref:LysR family transcriptional regulator n=1 Tax=Serratia marcescens TaxID=615 RepID=UPI0011E74036|nr:LysR family transcriptional regulator [Serratia marcescens]